MRAKLVGDDRLGREWSETENGFIGRWVRRGNSEIWDATWNNGAVAELSISIRGDKVRISRRDVGGPSIGFTSIYEGTLAPDGTMQGTETGTWPGHFTNKTFDWQGRIVAPVNVPPAAGETADWIGFAKSGAKPTGETEQYIFMVASERLSRRG